MNEEWVRWSPSNPPAAKAPNCRAGSRSEGLDCRHCRGIGPLESGCIRELGVRCAESSTALPRASTGTSPGPMARWIGSCTIRSGLREGLRAGRHRAPGPTHL